MPRSLNLSGFQEGGGAYFADWGQAIRCIRVQQFRTPSPSQPRAAHLSFSSSSRPQRPKPNRLLHSLEFLKTEMVDLATRLLRIIAKTTASPVSEANSALGSATARKPDKLFLICLAALTNPTHT